MKAEAFKNKVWLATPTMHGDELKYVQQAYDTNWMSTVGENINEVEKIAAEKAEMKYAVGLSCCTAALHLAVKHAGETLYGKPAISHGALEGKRVFCSDMTFDATLNPVVYEGGIPVFIDTEAQSWNMDPVALEKAFEMYPDVKLVVSAELYGFPGRMDLIKEICERHGALLVEDAAEAMGATIHGRQCGSFGDYSAISYNGNKIITGSAGGCLLTNDIEVANKARKWSTQARENAPWYQHEEVGYNYRMSNVIAGVVRGQYAYLEERGYYRHQFRQTEQINLGGHQVFRGDDGLLYGAISTYLSEVILYRSRDNMASVEFFAVCPYVAQYEFDYKYLNGKIYAIFRTDRDVDAISYTTSDDDGKTWSEPVHLKDSIQCRPRIIIHNRHVLLAYNYFNGDCGNRPLVQQGRTSVRMLFGENADPNTNTVVADLYSKCGIVNICLVDILGDLYFAYSTSMLALEYHNGNPRVRGKDALRYVRLGDLTPEQYRTSNVVADRAMGKNAQ